MAIFVTLNNNMNVRPGPGMDHPIIANATAGQQYAAISRSAAWLDWWQNEHNGRLAWLTDAYVTPSADVFKRAAGGSLRSVDV